MPLNWVKKFNQKSTANIYNMYDWFYTYVYVYIERPPLKTAKTGPLKEIIFTSLQEVSG